MKNLNEGASRHGGSAGVIGRHYGARLADYETPGTDSKLSGFDAY
jgi:hypothetical protein